MTSLAGTPAVRHRGVAARRRAADRARRAAGAAVSAASRLGWAPPGPSLVARGRRRRRRCWACSRSRSGATTSAVALGLPAARRRAHRAGAGRRRAGDRDRGRARSPAASTSAARPLWANGARRRCSSRSTCSPASEAIKPAGRRGSCRITVYLCRSGCGPPATCATRRARPPVCVIWLAVAVVSAVARDARALRRLPGHRRSHDCYGRPRPGPFQGPQRLRPVPRAGGRSSCCTSCSTRACCAAGAC